MADEVAIVHYWLHHVRGGEKVFFELARAFPEADLYFLHGDPTRLPVDVSTRFRGQTFLGRQLVRRIPYRAMLPLLPAAARSLDLSSYQTVISSSAGWAHGVRTSAGANHVCYMHSPPRYIWGEQTPVGGRLVEATLSPLLRVLRNWDISAASRVSTFVANSQTTESRITKSYGRSSEVVYPPVDVEPLLHLRQVRQDYVVAAGELVPYKRFDLAIDACHRACLPLRIVGEGPERKRLEERAAGLGADVTFEGRVSDEEFRGWLASARVFIHAGIEDFGITTVEALAGATPVVGANEGGTAEIVAPGTGVLATDNTAEAFAQALMVSWETRFDENALRARAFSFRPERFRDEIELLVRN